MVATSRSFISFQNMYYVISTAYFLPPCPAQEQSQSVVRGEHPITFLLPTVSMSEPCSEYSDLESLTAATSVGGGTGAHTSTGTFSSSAASPSISLATSPRR